MAFYSLVCNREAPNYHVGFYESLAKKVIFHRRKADSVIKRISRHILSLRRWKMDLFLPFGKGTISLPQVIGLAIIKT